MPSKRLNVRSPFIAWVNSSAASLTIFTLLSWFCSILNCAACTEGLAISVPTTLSKWSASGSEKLPAPQYISSKSPESGFTQSSAHSIMLQFTSALGWVKLFSMCLNMNSLPLTGKRSITKSLSIISFCFLARPMMFTFGKWASSFAFNSFAASCHFSSSWRWYKRLMTSSPDSAER